MSNYPPESAARSPEELAQITKNLIALLDSVYDPNLQNPLKYIRQSIRKMIDESTASLATKQRIDYDTQVTVRFAKRLSASLTGSVTQPEPVERQYSLEDIVTDAYLRDMGPNESLLRVRWHLDFPPDLIHTFENANLEKSYQAEVKQRLGTSSARLVMRVRTKVETDSILQRFADNHSAPAEYREIAKGYFESKTKLHLVEFGSRDSRINIGQVLYLGYPGEESRGGLLIFMNESEQNSIMILPYKYRRFIIENSPRLRRQILQRLPLTHRLRPHNGKLAYYTIFPVGMPRVVSPLQFRAKDNVFKALAKITVARMASDMDLLVLTEGERTRDQLLQMGAFVLGGIAMTASLPGIPGGGLALMLGVFLAGQGAAALRVLRAANSDDPQAVENQITREVALMFGQIVAPVVLEQTKILLLGSEQVQVANAVYEHFTKALAAVGGGHLLS